MNIFYKKNAITHYSIIAFQHCRIIYLDIINRVNLVFIFLANDATFDLHGRC